MKNFFLLIFILILINCSNSKQTNEKYKIILNKDKIFEERNRLVKYKFEDCKVVEGVYYIFNNDDKVKKEIYTLPIYLNLDLNLFSLGLEKGNTFLIKKFETRNIINSKQLETGNCVEITVEDITKNNTLAIQSLEICHPDNTHFNNLVQSLKKFVYNCGVNLDIKNGSLLKDFTELNQLSKKNLITNTEKDLFSQVSYVNPQKPKTKRDLLKEQLKQKVGEIKVKVMEKIVSEHQVERLTKLDEVNTKLKFEEKTVSKPKNEVDEMKNDVGEKALNNIYKLEKEVDSKIEKLKEESKKAQSKIEAEK